MAINEPIRYIVHTQDHGDDRKPYGMMLPCPNGEWIRYDEFQKIVEKYREAISFWDDEILS